MQKKSKKREGYKFILFFAVWALQKVQSTLEGERQESKKNPKKRKEDVAAVPFFLLSTLLVLHWSRAFGG